MGFHSVDLGLKKQPLEEGRCKAHIGPTVDNPPNICGPIKIVLARKKNLGKGMHVLKVPSQVDSPREFRKSNRTGLRMFNRK